MPKQISVWLVLTILIATTSASFGQTTQVVATPGFTVWDLWVSTTYRETYPVWTDFRLMVANLNGWQDIPAVYRNIQVGKVILVPAVPTLENTRTLSTQTIDREFLNQMNSLAEKLDQQTNQIISSEDRMIFRVEELSNKLSSMIVTLEEIRAYLPAIEQISNRLTEIEKLVLSHQRELSEKDDATTQAVIPWWILVLLTFSILCLVLLVALIIAKSRRPKEEQNLTESENEEETINTFHTYNFSTILFRLPSDLVKDKDEITLLKVGEDKMGTRAVDLILMPCSGEIKTQPIKLPNVLNHLRHCEVCRQQLDLQEISRAVV